MLPNIILYLKQQHCPLDLISVDSFSFASYYINSELEANAE